MIKKSNLVITFMSFCNISSIQVSLKWSMKSWPWRLAFDSMRSLGHWIEKQKTNAEHGNVCEFINLIDSWPNAECGNVCECINLRDSWPIVERENVWECITLSDKQLQYRFVFELVYINSQRREKMKIFMWWMIIGGEYIWMILLLIAD